MPNLKAVAKPRALREYYCLSCKMDMCSVIEAAAHLLDGCIVDSEGGCGR